MKIKSILALMLAAAVQVAHAQWDPYQTTAAVSVEEQQRLDRQYLEQARANIERIRKADVQVRVIGRDGKPVPGASLAIEQVDHDFKFGCLLEDFFDGRYSDQEQALYTSRYTALFNYTELTLVKWARYEPQRGLLKTAELDRQLDWASSHGIAVKGHTVGWSHNSGTPSWLYGLSHDEALRAFDTHVKSMVDRYKGRIFSWDVVNEPVTTIPFEKALLDIRGDGKIDDGPRYDTRGVTLDQVVPWVERTFRVAREADPNGEFHINEFHILSKPAMRAKYIELIKQLQARKVPLNGIGIQAHEPREMWFATPEIVKAFDQLHALGLSLHITEFIPQSSGKPITGGWRTGRWTEEAQAEFAEQFYTLAFGHPGMKSIHWWGLSDRTAWLPGGGLLDASLNPKPVYNRLLKLIRQDWMTRGLTVKTDNQGAAAFRGFYGRYRITVKTPDGVSRSFDWHLGEGGPRQFEAML